MQPEFVDGYGTLVFEMIWPFAPMFVLRVFPLWTDAFFEEMIVGLQGQFGGWRDIVLETTEIVSVQLIQ